MTKQVSGLGDVRALAGHVVRIEGQMGDQGRIRASNLHELSGHVCHVDKLIPADVHSDAWCELVHGVGQSRDEVPDVHEDPLVSVIDRDGLASQQAIGEEADHRTIGVVALPRSVGVEEAQHHGLSVVAVCKVLDLHFIDPLGDGVVIGQARLGIALKEAFINPVHSGFPVDLGGTGEDVLEAKFLLNLKDVAGADGVRAPDLLKVVFTIHAAKLGSKVKDQFRIDASQGGTDLTEV